MFQLFEILSAIQLRIDSAMIGSRIQGSRLHSSRSRPIIAELIRIEIRWIKSRNRVWIITKFHEDSQTSYSWCNSHICLFFSFINCLTFEYIRLSGKLIAMLRTQTKLIFNMTRRLVLFRPNFMGYRRLRYRSTLMVHKCMMLAVHNNTSRQIQARQ